MYTTTSTHTSLLARLADGRDATAWRDFSERYGKLICGFARRRGLQPADCDDVAQDVLLSLSKALPGFRYDPKRGKFRSFLKTVTLNVIIDRKRRQPGRNPQPITDRLPVAADDPEVEQAWEKEWRQYHLRQAWRAIESEFNQDDREAFRHYAFGQRDARETAAALRLSIDQVYQAKSRITKRLSEQIELQIREEG
jgi:RNA polymerase sigma-70 factor (ECF subfamily)